MVLASCHRDILEWLQPDWWFDTTDGTMNDGGHIQRPKIAIRVYPCKRSAWAMFAKHHYLTEKPSSKLQLGRAWLRQIFRLCRGSKLSGIAS